MLLCGGECLSCDSVSLPVKKQRGDGGRGSCYRCLVMVVWVLTLIHVTSVSLSPLHLFSCSLFSLHYTLHTNECARTHTHTPRFSQITQSWGTKRKRRQFASTPEKPPTTQQASQHLQTPQNSMNSFQLLLDNVCFDDSSNDEGSLASQEFGSAGIMTQFCSHIGQS